MKSLIKSIVVLSLLSFVTACGKAPEPKNQALDKGHSEPVKIEFLFTPGSLPESELSEDNIFAHNFVPEIGGTPVRFLGEYNDENKFVTSGPITLPKGKWHKLEVNFYNKSDVLLNHEFLTPVQQKMHQFFFRSYQGYDEEKLRYKKLDKKLINYKYGDVDEKGGDLEYPVGFTGYFCVSPTIGQDSFELRISLSHVTPPASKLDDNGKPYKYDSPSKRVSGVTDVDIRVTVNVK
ncbi:hypothetical protein HQ45_01055 [Porphyromonas crevioricanis]|uniref:hypothetical protein n=1 Tax=Porphyromonas crevioricanis TaxID=393921 RepID=UPI00052B6478|nr:hypothetical protein [Porphyromonas crevioricanis]KGN90745.1 hypothetical protein HQ45_01055 [Porphyromonas crevioricanis]